MSKWNCTLLSPPCLDDRKTAGDQFGAIPIWLWFFLLAKSGEEWCVLANHFRQGGSTGFFGGDTSPSLSINYVAMSKDMGKRLPQLYYINLRWKFLWSGFYCNRSRHGNVWTPLLFLFIFVFLCTRSFFLRNRLREFVPAIIASIMSKFEQILWERFRNILKWSFKRHKNSDIACYPDNYLIFYENDKLWKRGFIL